MTTYVEVAVNIPQVTGLFHYHLPLELEGNLDIGHLVIVPFGHQNVHGVILRFIDQPDVPETRPVLGLVDPQVVLTTKQIEFARKLSQIYLAPFVSCIALMLPAGLMQHADTLYSLAGTSPENLSENQRRLWTLLSRRGALSGQQFDRFLPHTNWRSAMRSLTRRGLVSDQSVLPAPRIHPKRVRTAQLACPRQEAEAALADLAKAGSETLKRRQAVLKFLINEHGPVDVSWVYAASGGNLADLRFLNERGLVLLGESEIWRDPVGKNDQIFSEPPQLTQDQMKVWKQLQLNLEKAVSREPVSPILLHGVTGSGKTEIYLRAVAEVLQSGRQVIVLVPEISLTPQTVNRFIQRFPGQVGLLHSGLSDGERYDTWRRARMGRISIIVGPRSALFSPFSKIGLIVVDECHDDSYYQSEIIPYYHAREAAAYYARICGAVCLLGSATPDVTSVYRCQVGEWKYVKLPNRILGHRQFIQDQIERLGIKGSAFRPFEAKAEQADMPPVSVIDMRQELKTGNRSIFSRILLANLEEVLAQKQQAILFLNRRGASTYIFCRDCGNSLKCPRCDLPLAYHSAQEFLICHHCGYRRKLPLRCPSCSGDRIRQFGTGTQKVESELQKLIPELRTLRWDYETTRKKGAHEIILAHFAANRADVLIGTQMLAKGLDLPMVTLVGVILADVGLNLPDYRASERTFQVLTQVAGRAGRSPLGGKVVLQTFQPEHYVIQAASQHNYRAFFQREMVFRKEFGYPPFTNLVRLEIRHPDSRIAEEEAHKLASHLQRQLEAERRKATRLIGPAPCFFARIGGQYRWQIILNGPDPVAFIQEHPVAGWKLEVNPPSLL